MHEGGNITGVYRMNVYIRYKDSRNAFTLAFLIDCEKRILFFGISIRVDAAHLHYE